MLPQKETMDVSHQRGGEGPRTVVDVEEQKLQALALSEKDETATTKASPPTTSPTTNKDNTEKEAQVKEEIEPETSVIQKVFGFYLANQFLIHILSAIALAKAYPPLGDVYLFPEITATWIAVVIIFVLSGLGLRTDEFSQAFQQIYFNVTVQVFNFGLVSGAVYLFSRFLIEVNWLDETLANGMVVCACCPMAINIVIVLTASTGGDEAGAIFNTTFSNIVGIFLSPALILGYLGSTSDIDLIQVFYKLSLRVVLPLAFGQLLQKTSPTVVEFAKRHKPHFKKTQEFCLVFIVYTVFCRTFGSDEERSSGLADIFLMIFFQFLIMMVFLALAWYTLGVAFPDKPKSRVMGLFGCTMKTVALGIPLINSIYEGSPQLGLYALPLLIWHPMQLVVGTLLTPRLARYVKAELKRLEDEEKEKETALKAAQLPNDPEAPLQQNSPSIDNQ